MSYYYLITSLPALSLGQAPISEEAFVSRCEAELSARDLRKVQAVATVPATDEAPMAPPFTAAWNHLEIQLRNAIARIRAAKRSIDATHILRPHGGFSTLIEDAVEDAWTQPTPLAREKALDTVRWQLLDDLVGPDPFSFNVILAYTIKRKLAERWSRMDSDTGWQKAQNTFEQQPAGRGRSYEPETAGSQTGAQN